MVTKFALFPLKIFLLLSDLERILQPFPVTEKNLSGSKYTNDMTNLLYKEPANHFLNQYYDMSNRFLKDHPDINIIQSDKGNVTFAMNRLEYVQLTQDLLDDDKYYLSLTHISRDTLQMPVKK